MDVPQEVLHPADLPRGEQQLPYLSIPNPHSWWAGLSFSIADLGSGIRCLFEPLDPGLGIGFFRIPDPQSIFLQLNDNFLG